VNAQIAQTSAQLTQTMAQLYSTNMQVNRVFDGAAMGIAMKDAIPNYGDRFAVRVNMGGFDSHLGGSISFAANVSDDVRLNVDFGQSRLQSAFSGGLNFSF